MTLTFYNNEPNAPRDPGREACLCAIMSFARGEASLGPLCQERLLWARDVELAMLMLAAVKSGHTRAVVPTATD